MPAWPATLPNPEYGMGVKRQSNRRSFRPESGVPKTRRRFSATGTEYECTLLLSSTLLATFNTFYDTTLEAGSLTFTMNEPRTGVSYNWIFDPDEEPSEVESGPSFTRVSFKLIRLP